MPGTFRFLLAVAVVLCHLIHMPYYRDLGYYAVRAFFVLSGFAMTAALNEVYGFEGKRFWINRFLRLVPPYLTVCFLTALAIRCYPLEAARFMPRWAYPATAADVAKNLSIMPLAFGGLQFRYIEPAWSLAVEIIMYAILWIGMGRSARGAFICFATGAAYHCYKLFTGAPFAERYFTPEGALLSFAAGALIYFWRERSTLQTRADFALFVSLAWLINFFAEGTLMPDGYAKQAGFYVNIALAALVVVSQPALRPGPLASHRHRSWQSELSDFPCSLVRRLCWLSASVFHSSAWMGARARVCSGHYRLGRGARLAEWPFRRTASMASPQCGKAARKCRRGVNLSGIRVHGTPLTARDALKNAKG